MKVLEFEPGVHPVDQEPMLHGEEPGVVNLHQVGLSLFVVINH